MCTAVGRYEYAGGNPLDNLSRSYISNNSGGSWILSNALPLPNDSPDTGMFAITH